MRRLERFVTLVPSLPNFMLTFTNWVCSIKSRHVKSYKIRFAYLLLMYYYHYYSCDKKDLLRPLLYFTAWLHQKARGKAFSWSHHFGGKDIS